MAPLFLNAQEEVFKVVEDKPSFAGCEDSSHRTERENCSKEKLFQFIFENVKYPESAKKKGMEGTAIVEFVIEKDGSVTNASLERNPGAGMGEEALRVVKMMPHFTPGTQRGKKVRVQYTLPVKFKLDGNAKKKERIKAIILN